MYKASEIGAVHIDGSDAAPQSNNAKRNTRLYQHLNGEGGSQRILVQEDQSMRRTFNNADDEMSYTNNSFNALKQDG